jgi:hypothetical protein
MRCILICDFKHSVPDVLFEQESVASAYLGVDGVLYLDLDFADVNSTMINILFC